MQNDEGTFVDLYVPRKCSATNQLITAKDHSSVQINIGHIDAEGNYIGEYSTFAFSGFIRQKGESDAWMTKLCSDKGFINIQ